MTLNRVDSEPIDDYDPSTFSTAAATPPDSNFLEDQDPLGTPKLRSEVPWPGSKYMLRDASSGHMLTLRDGQVTLATQNSPGSNLWECVEAKGWLGFRNPVSGKYLGHDARGKLFCGADRQQGWENFVARARPEGGFVLLLTHFERLWHVGLREEAGQMRLAKLNDGADDGIVWEFIKI